MKLLNKIGKMVVVLSLICGISTSIVTQAASTGKKYINSTYGYVCGTTTATKSSTVGKVFFNEATTNKKVTKIWTTLEVQYTSTGVTIAKGSETKYDKKSAFLDVPLLGRKNKVNSSDTLFTKTKCTGHGMAEAIIKDAYTVYTSLQY